MSRMTTNQTNIGWIQYRSHNSLSFGLFAKMVCSGKEFLKCLFLNITAASVSMNSKNWSSILLKKLPAPNARAKK